MPIGRTKVHYAVESRIDSKGEAAPDDLLCGMPSQVLAWDGKYPATADPTKVTCSRCLRTTKRLAAIGAFPGQNNGRG